MSNPTQGSNPYSEGIEPSGTAYDAPVDYTDQSGYGQGATGTDPYSTNVPYEPVDPGAPVAGGGYATTGTGAYTPIEETIGTGGPSTTDVAKDEAANVKDTAKVEAANVKDTAKVEAGNVKDTAVGEAAAVKDTAVGAGKQVAGTAKEEAVNVAGEAKQQAQSLLSSATSELKSQASTQQSKLATTLRGYTDQLQGLSQGQALEAGPLNDLVQRVSSRGSEIVSALENREPADLLDDLRGFARRRPALFLVLAGAAGVLAGRVTRGAVAANTSVDSPKPVRSIDTGYQPTTTYATTEPAYGTPDAAYGTTDPAYGAADSTYGAYTDAPAGGYETGTTYPAEGTSPGGYADRGDPIR